ncbi:MAG: hypothetical protein U5K69_01090 [Balneolaceae bacterium]|nr:hypothetical protein [Balneolaceae bacterium]
MTSKNKLKYIFIGAVIVAGGFALADSLGFFNPKPYTEVSHGSHVHYVPEDRDPKVGIDKFPTEPPAPNQVITPQGQIMDKAEWERQQQEEGQN